VPTRACRLPSVAPAPGISDSWPPTSLVPRPDLSLSLSLFLLSPEPHSLPLLSFSRPSDRQRNSAVCSDPPCRDRTRSTCNFDTTCHTTLARAASVLRASPVAGRQRRCSRPATALRRNHSQTCRPPRPSFAHPSPVHAPGEEAHPPSASRYHHRPTNGLSQTMQMETTHSRVPSPRS
jgi:hypothetical protein